MNITGAMDEINLEQFKGPKISCSPAINSLDDTPSTTVATNETIFSPFKLLRNLESGRPSLPFQNLNLSDAGRESLGILPDDFGRESLGILNLSGRESIGVLNMNSIICRESFGTPRESLGILRDLGSESFGTPRDSLGILHDFGRESLDFGRESLGILHLNSLDKTVHNENTQVPDIILSNLEDASFNNSNSLNRAFLQFTSRRQSAISSCSSLNSPNPSFNVNYLEAPSKIYSLSSQNVFELSIKSNNSTDILNRAFRNSSDFDASVNKYTPSCISPNSKTNSFSPNNKALKNGFNSFRTRIQSLPALLEEDRNVPEVKTKSLNLGEEEFDGEDSNNGFVDSVFIEANHIVHKMADGSIYEEECGDEVNILDSTPQPDWPEESIEVDKKDDVKSSTESVFKTVDKMLGPPIETDIKLKKSSRSDNSLSSNENDSNKSTKYNLSQNLSKISQTSEKNASRLLKNLSEIIQDTELLSRSQKSEGQNLLHSLADILCDTKSKTSSLEDSGNSSIIVEEKESNQYFEVLDLRTKSIKEDNSEMLERKVLDLSLKNKQIETVPNRRLSKSFSTSSISTSKLQAPILTNNANKSAIVPPADCLNNKSATETANSLVRRPSIAGKLRPTKVTHAVGVKKGPMKAVLPIGNMAKRMNNSLTPTKPEQRISNMMQSKRTSTPIREPKLKPMAASTPTARPSVQTKECAVSPLARPRKPSFSASKAKPAEFPKTVVNKSLSKLDTKLVRRNSVSEVKKSSNEAQQLKRSHSVSKETGIMSALSKIRKNLTNSPYYKEIQEKKRLSENNNSIVLTGNEGILKPSRILSNGVKTLKTPFKLKKVGKENLKQ